MPGKTGTISAHFNSAGKMGMQNKVLTIESNAAGWQRHRSAGRRGEGSRHGLE
ncbi:MAG: hypothetical protein WKG07_19430 [Hymenobacter sp.]